MGKIPDVVWTIYEEIATDTCNKSERLIEKYHQRTPEERGVMDDVFMDLCGWTFPSIVALAKQRENYLEVQDA